MYRKWITCIVFSFALFGQNAIVSAQSAQPANLSRHQITLAGIIANSPYLNGGVSYEYLFLTNLKPNEERFYALGLGVDYMVGGAYRTIDELYGFNAGYRYGDPAQKTAVVGSASVLVFSMTMAYRF